MGGEVRPGALAPSLNRVITSRLFRYRPTETRSPSELLRYPDERGVDRAEIIDVLTMCLVL
jgi:hypothetical protein